MRNEIKLVIIMSLATVAGLTDTGGQEPRSEPLSLVRIDMDICGMGQFIFAGRVEPGDRFAYSVPLEEVSDVLRNLTVDDPEQAVSYARVESLLNPVDLPQLPATTTFGDLLISMRGEEVEIVQTCGNLLSGRVVSVERQTPAGDQPQTSLLLTLVTEKGIQCLNLDRINTVRPARKEMRAKLDAALNQHVIADEQEYREIEVQFAGTKSRQVTLRLTRPLPIYRTTYSFSDSQLQQRIVFDNGTRETWKNVSIHFTDRSPVVFQSPLYEVVHSARPVIPMPGRHVDVPPPAAEALSAFVPMPEWSQDQLVIADRTYGNINGGGMGGGGMGGGGMGGGGMGGGGMGGGSPADVRRPGSALLNPDGEGGQAGIPRQLVVPESSWIDTPAGAGSPFAIMFTGLSIEPQQTHVVMTPNLEIDGQRLSYYRRENHPEHPLASLSVINRMPFRLPAGPITVFDDLGNAGEAMLPTLAPNVRRLVSFSIDSELKIRQERKPDSIHSRSLVIDDERFRIEEQVEDARVYEYQIENRGSQSKPLLLEHPKPTTGWAIVRPSAPEEQTDDAVRFRVETQSQQSTQLIVEKRSKQNTLHAYSSLSGTRLQNWLDDPLVDPQPKKRIAELLELHQQLIAARKSADEIRAAMALEKTEVSRIAGLLRSEAMKASNADKYHKKLEACESRILQWEADLESIRQLAISLLKLLGSDVPGPSEETPFGADDDDWLHTDRDPFSRK